MAEQIAIELEKVPHLITVIGEQVGVQATQPATVTLTEVRTVELLTETLTQGLSGPPGPTGPEGPQGPMGPEGPMFSREEPIDPIPPETGDSSYTHIQNSASTMWEVNHDLGKRPSVSCVDSGGTEFDGEVHYVDDNNLTVLLSYPTSGKVYCN